MIRDAFALKQQSAQPGCTPRHTDTARALNGHSIRPPISGRGVAADTRRQSGTFVQRHGGKTFFDTLVLVAKPLLKPQHTFADDAEAKMAGLDRACMHGSHRYLMNAVAFHTNEWIIIYSVPRGHVVTPFGKLRPQRKCFGIPCGVTQPWPAIIAALRLYPKQVKRC